MGKTLSESLAKEGSKALSGGWVIFSKPGLPTSKTVPPDKALSEPKETRKISEDKLCKK